MSKQRKIDIVFMHGVHVLPVCYYCERAIPEGKLGGQTIIKNKRYWVCKKWECMARLRSDFISQKEKKIL